MSKIEYFQKVYTKCVFCDGSGWVTYQFGASGMCPDCEKGYTSQFIPLTIKKKKDK